MKKAIEKILEDNSLKKTKGHIDVLGLLVREQHPLTIEEINKKLPSKINLTTIYRILDRFSQKNIIYQTNFLDGKSYFEFQKEHHHHITCKNCGIRNKINLCMRKDLNKINLNKTDFNKIDSHIFELFGICNKCKKA